MHAYGCVDAETTLRSMTTFTVTGINTDSRPIQLRAACGICRRENGECRKATDSPMFQDYRIGIGVHVIHSDEEILNSVICDPEINIVATKRLRSDQ
jgi:hypothetical protein